LTDGNRQAGLIFLSPAGKARVRISAGRIPAPDLAGLPRDLVLYLARHDAGRICGRRESSMPAGSWGIEHQYHPAVHAPDDRELAMQDP
jgi:hypothetical protein